MNINKSASNIIKVNNGSKQNTKAAKAGRRAYYQSIMNPPSAKQKAMAKRNAARANK